MDLADVMIRGIYRYEGRDVLVLATLPGGPSEDDPQGPRDADMVMIKYLGDDHKFVVDPADLETLDHEDDDLVPFKVTREMILSRRVDEL